MGEIVHISRGYEQFKEEISEEVTQRGKSLGVGQESLTTIEIGLSPFVPFSESFKMESTQLPSNGWGVGAEQPQADSDWEDGPLARAAQSPEITDFNVENSPGDKQKEAADNLARIISYLLYDEGITREANTPVIEEIQNQALAMFVTQESGWGIKKWRDQSSNIGTIERVQTEQLKALGGETFDMWAKNEAGAAALDMSLNMLHRQTGDAAFVKDVRALETTTMVGEKWFQQHTPKLTGNIKKDEKAITKAVNKEVQTVLKSFKALTKGLLHAHEKTPDPPKSTKGKESQAYFARQLFSRLYEFQHQLMQGDRGKNLGKAYIFAYPVDKWNSAYVRIQPFFKGKGANAELKSVKVKAKIVGGSSYKAIAEGKTYDPANPNKSAVFFLSSKVTYAAHTQILIMDLLSTKNFTEAEELQLATRMSQIAADQEVLKSGRGQMISVGLDTEFSVTAGNTVAQAIAVEGAEIMGKADAAKELHNQVKFILGEAKGKLAPEIERFYEQAMIESNKVTDSWIEDTWKLRLSDKPKGPYARAAEGTKGLFTDEKMMAGIGIPFWFTIGRDPSGYQKYKLRQTHEGLKGVKKLEETGVTLKEVGTYAQPLSTIYDGKVPHIRGPKGGMPTTPTPASWGADTAFHHVGDPPKKGGISADYDYYKGGRQTAWDPTKKVIAGTGGFSKSVQMDDYNKNLGGKFRLGRAHLGGGDYAAGAGGWGTGDRTLREIMESDRTQHSYSQPRDPATGRFV